LKKDAALAPDTASFFVRDQTQKSDRRILWFILKYST
jgi:hypothetical protein